MADILVDFTQGSDTIPVDVPSGAISNDEVEIIVSDYHSLTVRDTSSTPATLEEYDREQYMKMFDDETTGRYRAYRIKRQDPVTCEDMDEYSSFKFPFVWDCVTGERIGIDPNGPLYLSPVTVLRTILSQILIGLWTELENCVPMYGENVGVGKEFNIPGRGPQLEKYAFRLPIQDCYLYRDSDKIGKSVHTLGPEFTDDELREIDRLIEECWFDDPYIEELPETALSTYELRRLYDVALDPKPTIDIEALPNSLRERYLRTLTVGNIDIDHNEFINRIAVDEIKKRIDFRSEARF
jgi:hypothetical protein